MSHFYTHSSPFCDDWLVKWFTTSIILHSRNSKQQVCDYKKHCHMSRDIIWLQRRVYQTLRTGGRPFSISQTFQPPPAHSASTLTTTYINPLEDLVCDLLTSAFYTSRDGSNTVIRGIRNWVQQLQGVQMRVSIYGHSARIGLHRTSLLVGSMRDIIRPDRR